MRISTRPGMLGNAPALFAYRLRERSQSIGEAHQTKSGFWIVSYGRNSPQDVARTMDEAEDMLHKFYEPFDY